MRVRADKHHKWINDNSNNNNKKIVEIDGQRYAVHNVHDKEEEDLNIRGRPKRGVVSFQCEDRLWKDFDHKVEEEYGKYKKSLVLEHLIKRFLQQKQLKDFP